MELFAIAGGAGPGGEDVMGCCGLFVVLPSVVLLSGLAARRSSFWCAAVALTLAGLPFLLMRAVVAGYEPSSDGDVMSDQATGRRVVGWYAGMTAIAALSLLYVAGRRLGWLPDLLGDEPALPLDAVRSSNAIMQSPERKAWGGDGYRAGTGD